MFRTAFRGIGVAGVLLCARGNEIGAHKWFPGYADTGWIREEFEAPSHLTAIMGGLAENDVSWRHKFTSVPDW